MSLHIAIFEDDMDLAEHFKDLLGMLNYEVSLHYNFKKVNWDKVDIVMADYRNSIVRFSDAVTEAKKHGVPLIAISGGDMEYSPQLKKPFTMDEMQSTILQILSQKRKEKEAAEEEEDESIFSIFRSKSS